MSGNQSGAPSPQEAIDERGALARIVYAAAPEYSFVGQNGYVALSWDEARHRDKMFAVADAVRAAGFTRTPQASVVPTVHPEGFTPADATCIETCESGHRHARLVENYQGCPVCLRIGLDAARAGQSPTAHPEAPNKDTHE